MKYTDFNWLAAGYLHGLTIYTPMPDAWRSGVKR